MSIRARIASIARATGLDREEPAMAPPRLTFPGDDPARLVPAGKPGSKRLTIVKVDTREARRMLVGGRR